MSLKMECGHQVKSYYKTMFNTTVTICYTVSFTDFLKIVTDLLFQSDSYMGHVWLKIRSLLSNINPMWPFFIPINRY